MKKTLLANAGRNNYGYLDVSPGTDMAHRLLGISESTIKKYIRSGWLRRVGTGLVLTRDGYNKM